MWLEVLFPGGEQHCKLGVFHSEREELIWLQMPNLSMIRLSEHHILVGEQTGVTVDMSYMRRFSPTSLRSGAIDIQDSQGAF